MRYLKAGAAFLVAFLMQASLLNIFSILGHTPNLLLMLVVILSYLYEKELYGVVYGALFGLLYDMCYSDVIGPTPIALILTAACVVLMRYYANVENTVSTAVVSILAFIIYYAISWGLYGFVGYPIGFGYVLIHSLITIVYTLIITLVVYKLLIKNVVKHHKDRYFI